MKFLLILFFLKLNFFTDIVKMLEETSHLSMRTRNIINFIKLLCKVIIIAHMIACMWGYIGIYEVKSGVTYTWFDYIGIRD